MEKDFTDESRRMNLIQRAGFDSQFN